MVAFALAMAFSSCASRPPAVTLVPVTVEPRGQLVVATRTGEARFEEEVSRHLLARWVTASARIRVEARVSFDYYYDFPGDRCRITFDPRTGLARFEGGPLRTKKPVIESAKVLILEKSLWIHEEKEAVRILEHLGERLSRIGAAWQQEPGVQEAARQGLRDFMEHLAVEKHWRLAGWHGPGADPIPPSDPVPEEPHE